MDMSKLIEKDEKVLLINADVCDARSVCESTLAGYDRIIINTDILLENETSKAIMAKYSVICNADRVLDLEGDMEFSVVNGRKEIGPGSAIPEKGTFLIVNGVLEIAPGAEAVWKSYAGVTVNGQVICPESMSGLMGKAAVNGTMETYPDDCIRLKRTAILDRTFALRAREGARYYAGKRVVALDAAIDFAKLTEKGVQFVTPEALVAESLAEAAAPLLDERADITVLPDGCAFVNDDAVLDQGLLRRYGGKLYINGDLTVTKDSGPCLSQVEYLKINGDALVVRALAEDFQALKPEYDALKLCAGTLLRQRTSVTVDRAMLEGAEDGVSISECVNVRFEEDVPPELIREKLFSLTSCAGVTCTAQQRAAIELVAKDVAHLGDGKDAKEDGIQSIIQKALSSGGRVINADHYKL